MEPMSKEDAARLAAMVRAYWLERGHVVDAGVWRDNAGLWVVRSDLLNGLPRGRR